MNLRRQCRTLQQSYAFSKRSSLFHARGEEGGCCGRPGEAGGGGAIGGDNTDTYSGGVKPAHTSYSGPNCRRNKSENERNNTKTGSKITVPTYGIAAMQHVAHVTTHPTITLASARTIRNRQYSTISPGCLVISDVAARNASYARHRRRYITGTIKFTISAQPNTASRMMNTQSAVINNT